MEEDEETEEEDIVTDAPKTPVIPETPVISESLPPDPVAAETQDSPTAVIKPPAVKEQSERKLLGKLETAE